MIEFKVTTPVAFFIFNRPDTTERVFTEIAKAKPPKLLVVGDGPRASRQGEAERVASTRAIIQRVDWDCEVLTNFSDVNLGCKKKVSSGIDWVFKQVEEAIILEDDCLPHPTFFKFCDELLERYRFDQRIGMISGDNFHYGHKLNDDSYYFSKINHIWGWATWRDRWQNDYDVDLSRWEKICEEGRVADWFHTKAERLFYSQLYENVFNNKVDTWDYQWHFGSRLNGRISAMPNVNLISNIGFGEDATHTTDWSEFANMEVNCIAFPLKHPEVMTASSELDGAFFERYWKLGIKNRMKIALRKTSFGNFLVDLIAKAMRGEFIRNYLRR